MVVLPSDVHSHPPQFMPFLSNRKGQFYELQTKICSSWFNTLENKVQLYLHTAHKYQPFIFNRRNRFRLHWEDQIFKPQFNPYTTTTIIIGQKYQ